MCKEQFGHNSTANEAAAAQSGYVKFERASEQIMVDAIREDLGVTIDPQAWRMFVRTRWETLAPLAHRIHEGKR